MLPLILAQPDVHICEGALTTSSLSLYLRTSSLLLVSLLFSYSKIKVVSPGYITVQPRITWNLWYSCLNLFSPLISGIHSHNGLFLMGGFINVELCVNMVFSFKYLKYIFLFYLILLFYLKTYLSSAFLFHCVFQDRFSYPCPVVSVCYLNTQGVEAGASP